MFLRSLVVLVAAVLGSWIVGSGWWSHRGVPDRDLAFELQEERLLALAQRVAELPPEARILALDAPGRLAWF
ncbi:MAG: hypothetical protein KC656_34950, partial [Myxococcales bacterium]|nr:hypothetical protein [Myxococcales bacterium]